jgi:hypothetical protein
MAETISVGTQQTTVANALVPKEGPKAVSLQIDLTTQTGVIVDFTLAYMQQKLSAVQSAFVDNSGNQFPVTLTVDNPYQNIVCPALAQGSFPLVAAIRPKITVASEGAVVVPVIFLNVPIPAAVWLIGAPAVNTTPTNANAAAIATGGTAVVVFKSGTIKNGGYIVNPNAATESLFVDIVNTPGTAAPGTYGTTTELVAGQAFTVPPGLTTSVQANAVTSGHAYTAVQY